MSFAAFADEADLVNIKKISDISKDLVFQKKGVAVNDLEAVFINASAVPSNGVVRVEVHLSQLSTKKKLTPEEIMLFVPEEAESKLYDYYKTTTFTVTFNSDNPNDGLVIKGSGHASVKKP